MWQLSVFILCLIVVHLKSTNRPLSIKATERVSETSIELVLCGTNNNEALVVDTVLCGERALFQIDTGYAGAPVISKSYLSVQGKVSGNTIYEQYASSIKESKRTSVDATHRALGGLLRSGVCRSYTSGCTMRLMGIGSISEMQSDMLLCPSLAMRNKQGVYQSLGGRVDADVFMTHPLKGGVHILTCDYLLHRSPSVICPSEGTLWLGLSSGNKKQMEPSFKFHDAFFVGGSFAIMMTVGGSAMRVVVDTGATAPLSIGRKAAGRMKTCTTPQGGSYHLTQTGVNGERICSSAVSVRVTIGQIDVGNVDAFVNDDDVEGADAYAGLGMLRALDLWLEPTRVGVRRNKLQPLVPSGAPGVCQGVTLPKCGR